MDASEVAAGRPIEPGEAMRQIAYIRDLLESTKLRLAAAWPLFVMWGGTWLVGYSAERWLMSGGPGWLGWRWTVLNALGGIVTLLWVLRFKSRASVPTTTLERQIFWLQVGLFVLFFFGLPFVITAGDGAFDFQTFIPFYIGVAYFAAGVFLGKELIVIGGWIAACSVAAVFLPEDIRWLWFAVNGGGGLILTGLILRRQLRAS